MTERDNILGRIREALKNRAVPANPSHGHELSVNHKPDPRQWLPKVEETFEHRIQLFKKNAADLRAEFHSLNALDEACSLLQKLSLSEGWRRIGTHAGKLTSEVERFLRLPICRTDQDYPVTELESCDAAITECDALVAQTGSVLVTSRSSGGRALSVLPPHHIVLARREQLLGDLSDAFALLKKKYSTDYPSFISFITGPSRTGDIERVLVLGAHGPRRLTILCF